MGGPGDVQSGHLAVESQDMISNFKKNIVLAHVDTESDCFKFKLIRSPCIIVRMTKDEKKRLEFNRDW